MEDLLAALLGTLTLLDIVEVPVVAMAPVDGEGSYEWHPVPMGCLLMQPMQVT